MSAKIQIGTQEARELLSRFGLGRPEHIAPTEKGASQSNYTIRADGRKYILRIYGNRSEESVRFETETLEYLRTKSFPAPVPVGGLVLFGENPAVLFTFLEGETIAEETPGIRGMMAETAARLALAAEGFCPENTEARICYTARDCERLAREYGKNDPAKLDWYLRVLDTLELPDTLPMSVCHCDWTADNLLFENGRVCAVLDFDNANYTYTCFDLAYMLEPWKDGFAHDTWQKFARGASVLDLSKAIPLLRAYENIRPLMESERAHLFDVQKLGILVDCLWFFDRGGAQDFYERRKIEALDRIGRDGYREALFS